MHNQANSPTKCRQHCREKSNRVMHKKEGNHAEEQPYKHVHGKINYCMLPEFCTLFGFLFGASANVFVIDCHLTIPCWPAACMLILAHLERVRHHRKGVLRDLVLPSPY